MNTEDIQRFLDNKTSPQKEYVTINFRQKASVVGVFLRTLAVEEYPLHRQRQRSFLKGPTK
jgi:hypothetical protein